MGDLIRMPHNELTSVLEVLDRHGLKQEHLKMLRDAPRYTIRRIIKSIICCRNDSITEEQEKINLLKINRSEPFDPAKFFGKGYSIWRGPVDGDGLNGKEEQDELSLKLNKIHILYDIKFVPESSKLTGKASLICAKLDGLVCLDGQIFQTFWDNIGTISDSLALVAGRQKELLLMFFDGTTLRNPTGQRCTICLSIDPVAGPRSCTLGLDQKRPEGSFSVVFK
jgi:hypothetical protein